jgi:hypothetical protein
MEGPTRFPGPVAAPPHETDCFQLLADIPDYAIFLLNEEGTVVRANLGAERYAVPAFDAELLEEALRGGSVSKEIALRRVSGELAEVHLSLYRVRFADS